MRRSGKKHDLLNPLLLGLVAADQRVDRAKHRIGKVHTLDGIGGGKAAQSGLGAVVIDGVVDLVVAFQLIGKADDGLDGANLGEDFGGHVGVHESHKLLGGILVDGLGGNPELLEVGVAVAVSAFGHGGQSGESPLEALRAGRVSHFADHPVAVGHKERLVVQNQLLVLGEVIVVRIGGNGLLGVGGHLGGQQGGQKYIVVDRIG